MRRLPENILSLYAKNEALLQRMNFDPETDDPLELCSPDAYRSTGLLTERMISSIFAAHADAPEVPRHTIAKDIGMILVRPDMVHRRNTFEAFIRERFTLLHSERVTIDTDSYWQLYQHDLHRKETMHTRLSRAALYIGSACQLLIFHGDATHEPVADYTFSQLKGQQGVYEPGTLRGEVVYTQAVALGLHRQSVDRRLRIATDPFGSYRAAAARPEGPHAKLVHPLLFYTGVGVHVPNVTEINTDLPQLVRQTAPPLSLYQSRADATIA